MKWGLAVSSQHRLHAVCTPDPANDGGGSARLVRVEEPPQRPNGREEWRPVDVLETMNRCRSDRGRPVRVAQHNDRPCLWLMCRNGCATTDVQLRISRLDGDASARSAGLGRSARARTHDGFEVVEAACGPVALDPHARLAALVLLEQVQGDPPQHSEVLRSIADPNPTVVLFEG